RYGVTLVILAGAIVGTLGWSREFAPGLVHSDITPTDDAAPPLPPPPPYPTARHAKPPGLLGRLLARFLHALDTYLLEPIKTSLRVVHLFLLFLPLVVTFPVGYLGTPQPDRYGETAGRLWWYQFLTQQMAHAGPTFIKLCQWAASRSDIFPPEFCQALSRLHSQSTPHAFGQTRRIVENAFGGCTLEELFDEFDPVPLGTGAIAQVYRARFKPHVRHALLAARRHRDEDMATAIAAVAAADASPVEAQVLAPFPEESYPPEEDEVAVKVLHPRVATLIRRDLVIMTAVARLLDLIPTVHWVSLPDEVAQFGLMMQSQLDLRVEAANLLHFRYLFRNRSSVTFPYAWQDLSSPEVLVETYERAIPLAVLLRNKGSPFDGQIAGMGLNAFLKMVIYDNFIHADLHPGNILVTFTRPVRAHWFDRFIDRLVGPPGATADQRLKLDNWFARAEALIWADIPSAKGDPRGLHASAAADSPTYHLARELETFAGRAPSRHASAVSRSPDQLQAQINLTLKALSRHPQVFHEYTEELSRMGLVPQLVFLDTGLVATLNETNRRNFLDLFQAIASFDGYQTGQLMVERCRTPDLVIDPDIFALKMQHLILQVRHKTLKLSEMSIGELLRQVMIMVRQHHVKLEGDFVNVIISILILEGIGRQLDPNIDLLKVALPILRNYGLEETRKVATLDNVKQVPHAAGGGLSQLAWWFKVWLWLEAREWVSGVREFDFEDNLFGEYMYPDV
ncbi:hypothetical protein IWQ60_012394, partial [Tieghemiomyces parasiticus]